MFINFRKLRNITFFTAIKITNLIVSLSHLIPFLLINIANIVSLAFIINACGIAKELKKQVEDNEQLLFFTCQTWHTSRW